MACEESGVKGSILPALLSIGLFQLTAAFGNDGAETANSTTVSSESNLAVQGIVLDPSKVQSLVDAPTGLSATSVSLNDFASSTLFPPENKQSDQRHGK
jgi:hypothetical protein